MTYRGTSEQPESLISAREGFRAMISFLEEFYARAGDDFPTLLTDLEIQTDGRPLDPAAWGDWLDAVARVVNSPEARS